MYVICPAFIVWYPDCNFYCRNDQKLILVVCYMLEITLFRAIDVKCQGRFEFSRYSEQFHEAG